MAKGRIPPAVIKKWSQLKHDLLPTIAGLKEEGVVTAKYKKDLKKNVEDLFKEFDSGLSSKLKKGSTAKTDEEADVEIGKAKQVATKYLATVKAKSPDWGTQASSIAKRFTQALQDILAACDVALGE